MAGWRVRARGARAGEEARVQASARALEVGRARTKVRLAWAAWSRRAQRSAGARRLRRERRADADLLGRLRAELCTAQLDVELERRRAADAGRRAAEREPPAGEANPERAGVGPGGAAAGVPSLPGVPPPGAAGGSAPFPPASGQPSTAVLGRRRARDARSSIQAAYKHRFPARPAA